MGNEKLFAREIFELEQRQLDLLFSLERYLTVQDADAEPNDESRTFKKAWIHHWSESVSGHYKGKVIRGPGWISGNPELSKEDILRGFSECSQPKLNILLLEALVFSPYFNLNMRELGSKKAEEIFSAEQRKAWMGRVASLAEDCGVDPSILREAEGAYREALDDIGGNPRWKKMGLIFFSVIGLMVTAGVAAPLVGGAIGGLLGLSGAAATSAGLAFLGGGAIAAGGTGMFGGTVVLVGGGAIFGGLAAALLTPQILAQPEIILTQLAKLEAILKVFLRGDHRYEDLLQEAMNGHARSRKELVRQRDALKGKMEDMASGPNQNSQDIEAKRNDSKTFLNSLEKSLAYYKVAIERLNSLILAEKIK